MAMMVSSPHGHIHTHLTRSLEKILEEADQSGELRLSNRKLKDFPRTRERFNLSDTVIADLSKNRFTELPDEIARFHFLERLHCYHNSIRSIPDSVSNLQSLCFLDLSRNQLTTLPREICLLPIEILLVANNKLPSLPDELYKMSSLTELDASCNQITHFPPRMGELKSLQSLVLRNNLLLAVPVEITTLCLTRLDLRANRIEKLPIEMRNMTDIIDLLLDENPLTGPPASLVKRGRVHIFKYLETEAIKFERKTGGGTGTLGRRSRKGGSGSPGPPHMMNRLKNKRHNVDSGYSTSSEQCEKRWSQELMGDDKQWPSTPILGRTNENSATSTPSTISPAPLDCHEEDFSKSSGYSDVDGHKDFEGAHLNGGVREEKQKNFPHVQTYREYKEALKQQRNQPAVYRTKDFDEQTHKTEPNTPTHQPILHSNTMATSKSDPTPLNSAFSNPKSIFDDTVSAKKPVQKVTPSRNIAFSPNHVYLNGNTLDNKTKAEYIKPKSPNKSVATPIMSHDNVPLSGGSMIGNNNKEMSPISRGNMVVYGNGGTSTPKSVNGVKAARNISWNKDVVPDKITFTMRREIDKAREETDLINQLRNIIESRLKMSLPENLAPALTDGVVLCHLANHIKPRSVASIHVPSPAVPKLTMARCRRNVDNFIEACRKIGVDEGLLCSPLDITEALNGRGLPRLVATLEELCKFDQNHSILEAYIHHNQSTEKPLKMGPSLEHQQSPMGHQHGPTEQQRSPTAWDQTVSLLLLSVFVATVILLVWFPPPK